jgi:hypothetical protein
LIKLSRFEQLWHPVWVNNDAGCWYAAFSG